jgi:hypothetical protein
MDMAWEQVRRFINNHVYYHVLLSTILSRLTDSLTMIVHNF